MRKWPILGAILAALITTAVVAASGGIGSGGDPVVGGDLTGTASNAQIGSGAVAGPELAATVTFSNGDILDTSASLHDDAAPQGFRAPLGTGYPVPITGLPTGHLFVDSASGRFLISRDTGAPWRSLDLGGLYAGGRRIGIRTTATANTTTWAVFGICAATVTASPTAVDSFNEQWVQYPTANAINNETAGMTNCANSVRLTHRPLYLTNQLMGASVANQRHWIAITTNVGGQVSLIPAESQPGVVIDYIGIAYDGTNGGPVAGNFLCCSGDGANASCIDTGVTVGATTAYSAVLLDYSVAGVLYCGVGGTVVSKTTNLPTDSGLAGLVHTVYTLVQQAGTTAWSGEYLERNF